jgi:hypothetical protein
VQSPTPGDGLRAPDPDPLVGEIQRERRDRRVLVIAAAIGIISGAVVGMAFMLGAIDDAGEATGGLLHGHGALLGILGPPVLCMAIGYAIFALRRRRRRR